MKIIVVSYGDLYLESGYATRIKNEIQMIEDIDSEAKILLIFTRQPRLIPSWLKDYVVLCFRRLDSPSYFVLNLIKASLVLKQKIKNDDQLIIIHAHNLYSAFLGLWLKKLFNNNKLIFDMHGLVPLEFIWLKKGRKYGLKHIFLRFIEKLCIRKSDYIICASNSLKQYIINKYKTSQKIEVIRNISFFPKRNLDELDQIKGVQKIRFGLKNKFIIAHLGSFLKWTYSEKLIEIFRQLKSALPCSFLVLITNEEKQSTSCYLSKYGLNLDDFFIINSSHKEVCDILPLADIGLIVRDNSIINRIAFPTKFSEYVACGVPVICSDSIEDVVSDIRTYELGFVLENNEVSHFILKGLRNNNYFETIRSNCVSYFAAQLETTKENLTRIYQQFISS